MTLLPYATAWHWPPRGTSFIGFFYYVDDQYNYLSYAEQAARGAFLFENKLTLEPHAPSLINLEWWLVGRLSTLLGGRPFLAVRILGAVASYLLLASADRWLSSSGVPPNRRVVSLLFVGLGGGLGALAWRAGALPLGDAVDLTTGALPFVEILANPHFVTGTALLSWSLWRWATASRAADFAQAIALGTVLGLVRPYDLVLLAGAHVGATMASEPTRRWLGRLAPLGGLLPVAAFDAWVFFLRPEYRGFGLTYEPVSPAGLVLGLGPAAALALLAVKSVPDAPRLSAVRPSLAAWALIALVVALSRPVGFAAQFLVGCGLPLLTLGVIGLTRWPRAVTLLVMGLLSPTAVIALELTLSANPRWFAPTERMAVAAVLRDACAPGDLLMAPPDIGLPVMGLTPCRAFTSHAVEPDHAARLEAMTRFYADQDPASRAAQLDRLAVSHVVLPGDPGPVPVSWLGPTTRFRRVASEGEPTRLSVYRRQ